MSPRLVVLCAVPMLLLAGCASGGHKSQAMSSGLTVAPQSAPSQASPSDDAPLPGDPIANQPPMPMALLPAPEPAAPVLPATYVEASPEAEESYLLDAGDRVRVFVYGQPNLSRSYAIDGGGFIAMPLIGSVKARGTTTYDLAEHIKGMLRTSYVRDPVVTVEISQYRPYFILGEVKNAGQFAYAPGMTVEMAVATAGGYGPRAYTSAVKLARTLDGAETVTEVSPTTRIRPGDRITVEERFF